MSSDAVFYPIYIIDETFSILLLYSDLEVLELVWLCARMTRDRDDYWCVHDMLVWEMKRLQVVLGEGSNTAVAEPQISEGFCLTARRLHSRSTQNMLARPVERAPANSRSYWSSARPKLHSLDQAQLGWTSRAKVQNTLCFACAISYMGLFYYGLLPNHLYMTSSINRSPYSHSHVDSNPKPNTNPTLSLFFFSKCNTPLYEFLRTPLILHIIQAS